jgi:hypothetical protein
MVKINLKVAIDKELLKQLKLCVGCSSSFHNLSYSKNIDKSSLFLLNLCVEIKWLIAMIH